MPYIEGPFSTKTYREARADEEAGRDREWQLYRQQHRRKILKAWEAFGDYPLKAGGKGGGAGAGGGGSTNGYIDDNRNMIIFDDNRNAIIGDDVGVYF